METRITELPNPLSRHIDAADPRGIVSQLCQIDAQLFSGWGSHPSVNDTTILTTLSDLSHKTVTLLKENQEKNKRNVCVFSGCGTSGRIAWMCSRAYNGILSRFGHAPCVHYLIAGGDESLIVSKELPEDDPPQGAEDLKRISEGADHVMYVGITCGLSAPYTAGQVDYAMQQSNMTVVLVGFNPVSLSRHAPIEKWNKTCRDVFLALETRSLTSDNAFILNPIVGPEAITGSSRMKGGSMTSILLDTVFLSALQALLGHPITPATALAAAQQQQQQHQKQQQHQHPAAEQRQKLEFHHFLSPSLSLVCALLDCHAQTCQRVYRHSDGVAALMELAASCLCQPSGRLVYLGANTLGAVCLVDASEMVATYGAGPEEIRGYVQGGWRTCRNSEGDLRGRGRMFQVSLSDFENDILPHLTSSDCVLCIHGNTAEPNLHSTMDRVLSGPARCGLLVLAEDSQNGVCHHHLLDTRYVTSVFLSLPHYYAFGEESVFAGFGLKLVLNAVSTGANILKGRVHGNTMINLTLSNDKLFYRALNILQELSGASYQTATRALLQAIHRDDNIAEYEDKPVSSHIAVATTQNMVIPLALMLVRGQSSSVTEAEQRLQSIPSLNSLISDTATPHTA